MKERESLDVSEFRGDRLWVVATAAPKHPTLRLVAYAYVFAGLCHLWLADAWQIEWLPGNIAFLAGLMILVWRPAAAGWALCMLGKCLPLLFGRDHLTQSVILMVFAGGGTYFIGLHAYLSTWPGRLKVYANSYGEISGPLWGFFDLLRLTTIATYGLAALHKLNRDFFDPAYTCAVYGLDKVADYYGAILPPISDELSLATATTIVAVEAGIALGYLLGYRRLILITSVAFHIPLTLTMAPAFAFVMLVGHAAFLRPADIDVFWRFLRRRWAILIGAATAVWALSTYLHGGPPFSDWTMAPREWLLWALLILTVSARPWRPDRVRSHKSRTPAIAPRLVAWTLAGLFVLHGLTPYLGLRFQNTGAMVSNLRIDQGCWNHLFMPESLRLRDDYIRVDTVYFGRPGRVEKYENIVRDQLWNGPMVRQMRKNWCREEMRPFYMAGTFRERTFEIDDLCAEDLDWPFADDGIFGVQIFENHLRFQRNLARECPQTCIH